MALEDVVRRVLFEHSDQGTWKGRWESLDVLENVVSKHETLVWDYLVQDFFPDHPAEELEEWLQDRGREGWELVALRPSPAIVEGGFVTDRVVLKRPLKAKRSNTFMAPIT